MKKLKIKLLLLQYEIELKQGNYEHLKDYIASNVILSLSKPIFGEYNYNEITLNKLVNSEFSEKTKNSCNYKVPSINVLNYIIKTREKELRAIRSEYATHHATPRKTEIKEEITAAIWLKLMLENSLILEKEIIDINEYKLKNFITDPRLIEIAGISEFSNIDIRDFVLDKQKTKVKINKSK